MEEVQGMEVPAEAAAEPGEKPAEAEVETQEEVAGQAEQVEAPAEQEPAPPKKSAQQRIDEITKARREAEREREYWKRVALEKEQAEKPAAKPVEEANPAIPARPKLEQFESTEAYEDALFQWNDNRREVESQSRRQRAEQEEAVKKFNKSAEKLREEHEDFDEVIEAPVFSSDMRIILLSSDNGPAVAYHLGRPENRDLADKIRSLPARQQIYELGKLEQQLLIAAKTKKVPSAPAPINPVGGSSGGVKIDESKLTDAEWYELEKKRIRERAEAKYKGG